MKLINLVPMLINIRRTRLFLAFIQQRAILDGTPTIRLQEQPVNFTLIPHQDSVYKYNRCRNYNVNHIILYSSIIERYNVQ